MPGGHNSQLLSAPSMGAPKGSAFGKTVILRAALMQLNFWRLREVKDPSGCYDKSIMTYLSHFSWCQYDMFLKGTSAKPLKITCVNKFTVSL